MKYLSTVITTLFGVLVGNAAADSSMGSNENLWYTRETLPTSSMWTFGKSGVSVYTLDGSEVLKHNSNSTICGGEDCGFKEAVSDGKRYVFATNTHNDTVDVFSIDSGEFVASLDTCGFPWSLDYHPVRDEIWVHCWGPDLEEGDTGHVDVFAAGSIHTPLSQVKFPPELVGHAHGKVIVDSSLGHIGYSTDLNTPSLFSYDLNTKKHLDSFDMPNVSGLYRMEYSHVNRHLYLRAYVCCSCGYDGADLAACGRGGSRPVNVTTGPNPGMNLNGTCGHGCEGSPADDIGVYEFDTVSGSIVTQWQIGDGLGADPYVSPFGDFVAFFGNNAGKTVRLLKADQNGLESKLWADVDVGFHSDDVDDDEKSVSDAVFIRDSTHNIVIFSSTLSNSIALVDLSGDSPIVSKLQLTDATDITSNHGRGARRNVVWAEGTNYVWVDSEVTEEFHLIKLSDDGDVTKAMVEKTFSGAGVRRMVYVKNYAAMNTQQSIQDLIDAAIEAERVRASQNQPTDEGVDRQEVFDLIQAAESGREMPLDETVDSVGTTGLIISIVALTVGLINLVAMRRSSGGGGVEEHDMEASLPSMK